MKCGRHLAGRSWVQVLTRHGDRASINPLPFETQDHWAPLLPTEAAAAALARRAAPVPANTKMLRDTVHGQEWQAQLTTQGVQQLAVGRAYTCRP
jgi:hypothetical protein